MQELKSSDHMCSDLGRVAHDMSTRKVEFGGVPELGVGWLDRKVQLIEIPEGLEIPKVRLEKFDPLSAWEKRWIESGEKGKNIYKKIWDKREHADHQKEFVIPELDREEVKHIRRKSSDEMYGAEMLRMIDDAENENVVVGFDTEGGDATCQLSVEGETKRVLVYQLASETGSHCLEKGQFPSNLVKILTHFKAIHAGKCIKGDLISIGIAADV